MHLSTLTLLTLCFWLTNASSTNATYLTAPALVTVNNCTVIQCWRLTNPFSTSSTPGTVGAQALVLSNVTNFAYTVLPPRFNGGQHTAPAPQIVHFVSGLAHITLPEDPDQDLWLLGGKSGLLFATDTTGSGHVTRYPSDEATVGMLAPFEGGKVPGYEVLKEGACEGEQTFV
ncbi:hypothetical protein E8E13_002103 [Curvularia kusanoi]|uniref:Small secreted protein n=1 Tax=Curvularia kusanoi TaxID=90978 RepID=A0A9P4T4I9_CURKU|nr:hypothetical protein E8E13_002103 [Curvularia kusanoi]